MTTKETLEQARALIADPTNWERGWGHGSSTCAIGAVRLAVGARMARPALHCNEAFGDLGFMKRRRASQATSLLAEVISVKGPSGVIDYNDSMPHHCVIEAFDAAIAHAD